MSQKDGPALTLMVETPNGVFLRPVAHALPLPEEADEGPATEAAIDACAATWGLPDFVYRPVLRKVASGNREVGDRILLVGKTGLVIQIKRRTAPTTQRTREEAWIRKAAAKGLRQARGTIRGLSSHATQLVNDRGREIAVGPGDMQWMVAVILDHDDPPEGIVFRGADDLQAIVLLRRDWEFLFDQLRSTHAVVEYLKRAAASDPVDLGREPLRYYEFAAADAATPPSPLDPRIVGEGFPVELYVAENDRVAVLSEIDRLPVAHRTELGELLLEMMKDVAAVSPSETKWRFRRFRFAPPQPHLAFGACSRFSDVHFEAFRQWVALRHHEFGIDLGAWDGLVTVGVLLTPRSDGRRPWDTTMVRAAGNLELSEEELKGLSELWNRPHGPTVSWPSRA
jgi:hypothetical protein